MRKPYFHKKRGCWFVKSASGKSQINLGPDEEKPPNHRSRPRQNLVGNWSGGIVST